MEHELWPHDINIGLLVSRSPRPPPRLKKRLVRRSLPPSGLALIIDEVRLHPTLEGTGLEEMCEIFQFSAEGGYVIFKNVI